MKKAAIVTFIRAYNHGAVLQGYALHKTLQNMGIDNEMLDYFPPYFRHIYSVEAFKKWKWCPGTLYGRTRDFLCLRTRVFTRNRKFEKFIRKNIRLSRKQYHTVQELHGIEPEYDAYISGSDQVWNNTLTEFDPTFFLDFPAANNAKKISYAASFGFNKIPEGLVSEYRRMLKDWDAYSVREKNGITILEELLGVTPVQCCDPSLLLERREWEKVATLPRGKEPYVLAYYVAAGDETLQYADRLAREKGLKLVCITSMCSRESLIGEKTKQYNAEYRATASPDDFLGLISQASYVITDSFHATVFSMMFHTPFMTLTNDKGRINHRVLDLLEYVGIDNRQLSEGLQHMDESIDWENVDRKLEQYRNESKKSLETLINN